MRAFRGRWSRSVLGLTAVMLLQAGLIPLQSAVAIAVDCEAAADPETQAKLDEAKQRRKGVQGKLDKLLDSLHKLSAGIEEAEQQHAEYERQRAAYDAEAVAAHSMIVERVRRDFKLRRADPMLAVLSAGSADDVIEQSRLLGALAEESKAEFEIAHGAAERTAAATQHAEEARQRLDGLRDDYGQARARTEELLDEAESEEAAIAKDIALENAARGTGCPLPPGQIRGGLACPVDEPRSYTDTYGAPRSGGRAHKGVDILAPYGTPVRAYEDGTITRASSNSLGGISLYLRGDSGNEYYYTHLSGYVTGLAAGKRADVGQHIAFVGDTGNARGIPHLHWEVRPGGANVNPTPYADAACG